MCGQRAPVLSHRGIEHTVIDVTRIPDARISGEAVLSARRGEPRSLPSNGKGVEGALLELLPRLARCSAATIFRNGLRPCR